MVKGREPFAAPAGAADYRRRVSASAERNRDPILAVLTRVLPAAGTVLEVASGTGQHAAYFAPRLPSLVWQPSDPDPEMRASIAAWVAGTGAANLKPPLDLDVLSPSWPVESAAVVVAINMIQIAPWAACEGTLAGAWGRPVAGGRLPLPPGDQPQARRWNLAAKNAGVLTVLPPGDGARLIVAVGSLAEKTRQPASYTLSVSPAD